MRKLLSVGVTLAMITVVLSWALPVPSTLNDFFLPGSQPGESGNLEHPSKCDNCHGGYDLAVEPAFNWRGSMMAQAARDPLFYACMAIANQDAPESGDLCIRCHSPAGWLEGRSVPTDGSALNNNDREGVQCDFCHKLVKPTPLGTNPYPDDPDYTAGTFTADQQYLATITEIPPASANGMYICDPNNAKRGPFVDAAARHQMYYSPFHKEAAICGTCHDVSNPAFVRNPDDTYSPNAFDAPAPDFDPYTQFPIERTYSEWLKSEYNSVAGVYAPQFGGNKTNVSTCQDCHMRDVTGMGCNKKGAPIRSDLPLHDMTGGNTFIPGLVAALWPDEVDPAALQAGVQRATEMLQKAASMDLTVTPSGTDFVATVRVTNETGHKLPSGYPEGRRIWINFKVFDGAGNLIKESGAYDPVTAELTHDAEVKIYEIKPGISEALAPDLGLDPGPSFHFVINHEIFKDNRIPPRGFTNAAFDSIQSPPVGYTYADGQYWDETQYAVPAGAARVEATLYYQTLSKDYVTFLRDANVTNHWGQTLYDLWNTNGKSAPVAMNSATLEITTDPPVADFSGTPTAGFAPLAVQFTDLSTNNPTAWSWDFGDGNSATAQNPSHTYQNPGVYTVTLAATNDFGSGSTSKTDYITVNELTQTVMYVSSILVTRQTAGGPNRIGQAEVTVMNSDGLPVAGAAVSGSFNAPDNTVFTAATDASGVAILQSNKTRTPPADWCFTVTGVAASGYIYDAGMNVVTAACETGPAATVATLPEGYHLEQNYPNPFNPTTEITFAIPVAREVRLEIFNVRGQLVTTLVDDYLESGQHAVTWDASGMSSGVYFYRLEAGEASATRKMMLIK